MQRRTLNALVRFATSLAMLGLVLFITLNFSSGMAGGGILDQASAQRDVSAENRTQIAPDASGTTVITGQGFEARDREALIAISSDGRLLYYNDSYGDYGDVDPSPEGKNTVTYIASEVLNRSECGAVTKCSHDVLVRTNLSTGESELLYSRKQAIKPGENIHDVDRIDDSLFIVSDIVYNRVYIVNVTTDLIVWQWDAQQDFPLSGGGKYPEDWTHMNDVEVVGDHRYMVSLRNQDQVVFLDRSRGLLSNMTLGAEDAHDVMFEQHNPDYIPEEHGGPAVVIADSQNNRIVEYQRRGGEWERTWTWRDSKLRWPRDADRLPDGHTLITDSNGDRVFEIDRDGEIVWSVEIASPYEAERLETGDESTGGPSATRADLPSRVDSDTEDRVKGVVENTFSPKVVNALRFIYPGWADLYQVVAAVGVFSVGVLWLGLELWLTRLSVRFRWPLAGVRFRTPIEIGVTDDEATGEEQP